MYVLTYTTDQNNRLVARMHHLMLGTTLRDDSFINVIYQKNLDVLDVPFGMRPDRAHPGGRVQHERVDRSPTTPARAGGCSSASPTRPTTSTAAPAGRSRPPSACAPSSRLSSELQYNRNDVKMPWGDFLVNLATLRVDYTFSPQHDDPQPDAVQHAARNEISNNVRFNLIHRPGSDLYVVYNDLRQTGLPADVFAQKDRQLVVKLNYLIQK